MITSRLSYPPLSLRVLSRIYRNGPFGKSARVSVILLFLLTLLIFPTSTANAATYGGMTETGGATCTYSGSGPTYGMSCTWSAGSVPDSSHGYLRTMYLCNGVWHYGSPYTDYTSTYSAGSYSGFSFNPTSPGAGCPTPLTAMGFGFTNFTSMQVGSGGATDAGTTPGAGGFARLMDAFYVPGYTPGPSPAPTGTGNNCTMTDVSLVRLARGAGFSESAIQTAVAVAIAESAGKVNALHYNSSSDSYDIGLWQINDVAHSSYDRNLLYTSPGYNALKAYDVYHTATPTIDRFTPWVTYNSGAYNKFMSRAATALQAASTGTLGGNSCNDLSGSDVVEDATDDNTVADDDPNCTMTFNVMKILKCVFIPSAQDTSDYSSKIDTVKTNPPVSVVLAGMTIGRQMLDPSTVCEHECPANNNATNTTRGYFDSDAQAGIKVQLPDSAAVTYINPIQKAGDWVQNTGGTQPTGAAKVAHFMYILGKFAIIVMFGLYWFRRFTSSLGSKE